MAETAGTVLVLAGVAAILAVAFVPVESGPGLVIARIGAVAFLGGAALRIATALLR